jgi:hypothetical protein
VEEIVMTVSKQDVLKALSELRKGRSRAGGDRAIRSIVRQFGNGANNVGALDPAYYAAVYAAAGGDIISAVKFYGAVVDLPATITILSPEDFFGVVLDVPDKPAKSGLPLNRKSPTRPILRLRSPLVADLEAKLKARAGKPRSKPNYVVNTGNPAHFGDQRDDVVRDFPAGERVR